MRIIGGQHRSRRLEVPSGQTTRPTTDRMREALFNVLHHRGVLDGAYVTDVFAGTGALGLEALSRGAAHVTFIEHDRQALAVLKRNIETLNEMTRTSILPKDAVRVPPREGPSCNLVFLDPPYGKGLMETAVLHLKKQGWLAESVLLVCEQAKSESPLTIQGFTTEDTRHYGETRFTFLGCEIV